MRDLAKRGPALPEPFMVSQRTGRWGDLAPRLLSALVLLPLALLCCWWGGPAWTALLVAAVIMLALEWFGMCRAGRLGPLTMLGGVGYALVAMASLLWLRADPADGLRRVLFLLVVVWATDIGAYLAGRWLGGPRMAPMISPGKTWSGAVGGAVVAVGAGMIVAALGPHHAGGATAVLALILSVSAQAGDLLESAAKRRCGVKDAGRLIPGHGGLLDRVDGILAAAPMLAALGLWFGRGNTLWN